jgi:CBS domain-containing protein
MGAANKAVYGGQMLEKVVVSEWMSKPVVTVEPSTPLKNAHQIMKDCRIRRLPVVKDGHLVGIITSGDIREASPSDATSLSVWELNYLWDQLTVEHSMTRDPVTVKPETTILEAARLMLEKKISGMPVVDTSGHIVGILTESDIFKMLVESRVPDIP